MVVTIRGALVSTFLFLALLACIVLELLVWIAFFPWPLRVRAINGKITAFHWRLSARMPEALYGLEYRITGDPVMRDENAIWICNHRAQADIPVLWRLGSTAGRTQDVKFLAKKVLKYVPVVGLGMQLTEQVFVSRRWSADREVLERALGRFKAQKIPLLLILFPEGTRFAPSKLRPGVEPRFTQVLAPRPKGFVAAVTALRDYCSAVYDITLAYEGGGGEFLSFYGGAVSRAHLHVRRYPVELLPAGAPGLESWLEERFLEKEAALRRFPDGRRLGDG